MYTVKARYYSDSDQFGETFVVTSDNYDKDLRVEVGKKVKIIPVQNSIDTKIDVKGQLFFNFAYKC